MTTIPLRERARPPTDDELAQIPWFPALTPTEQDRACAALVVSEAAVGDTICRIGRQATYWFGLVDGLLKMSNDDSQGLVITFAGVAPGGWFGEGTVLKREAYRYNIQALRKSRVAGLPSDTFHWLIEHSQGFNRFVMLQLNERLGQFIAAREIDRLNDPNLRVARSLASLVNPVLYPSVGSAAHHPAGVGLSGGSVTTAGERGSESLGGARGHPGRIRWPAGIGSDGVAHSAEAVTDWFPVRAQMPAAVYSNSVARFSCFFRSVVS